MSQFDNVSVLKQANVYFDGKCISHTVVFGDGEKKTVGVILPSKLTFNTGAPELMEAVAGACFVKLASSNEVVRYEAGQSFEVPGNSSFEIEVRDEPFHYVCHFA